MTLHSRRFANASELCKFVNASGIATANIEAILSESASGGFTLFWWA